MTDPARIGEVRFTYTYPSPAAAKVAWERAERRVRFISVYRHALDGDINRQAVTVLAEDDDTCRPQVRKARHLLAPGSSGEIETPALVFDVCYRQRLQLVHELPPGGTARRKRRFGEGGAFADDRGQVRPRRRQG